MAILIDKNTRVIVQGVTGHHGLFHAGLMVEYGTKIVAGVTPGKGGTTVEADGGAAGGKKIPVFDSVAEALEFSAADYSIIFVPAAHALEAAEEALGSNLNLVIITEHMPVRDTMLIMKKAAEKNLIVIGPNCPGIITPEECKIGIMPVNIFKKGKIGVISRSGTLTYEIVQQLTLSGLGQSTVVGIGGDSLTGFGFNEALESFENDPETAAIVLIGEIGGDAEERAALLMKSHIKKPAIAYIAGRTAPSGKTMGHAGAIISGKSGTYASKISALKNVGVKIAELPWDVPRLVLESLK
jgi:succinyl-CoA synthetase alpha subunit